MRSQSVLLDLMLRDSKVKVKITAILDAKLGNMYG